MNNQIIYSIILALAAFFCMASWHHASEEQSQAKLNAKLAENFSEERVQESIRKTDEYLGK